jgi:acyl-[acyl-carrier-protein]-phospholipid O-acyltransferase / long-chain-fatty-acid--[acyl-carrier-protein] ligase
MTPPQKKSFWALMAAQFLGAFNDNVLKTLVTLLILRWVTDQNLARQLVDLSGAIFVAPFLMFSMLAGRMSDRFGKPKVIVAVKYWEVVVVAAAVLSVVSHSLPFMMITLFFLAMHSAFFSPSKYGILPELMGEEELSGGNGLINMLTFLAIILGTLTAAFLSENLKAASLLMASASIVGLIASHFIDPLPAARPDEPWTFNPLRELAANWRLMKGDRALRVGGIAVNYFWFMGSILQLNIFVYAKEMMQASDKTSGTLLIAVLVGIALGSFLAGKVSGRRVELGLVPLGALGMSVFAVDLMWAYTFRPRLLFDLFMLGFSAGFYEIPLMAMLQWRSPPGQRGRVMATINFFSFIAILSATGVLWGMHAIFDLNPAKVFFILGSLSLIATVAFWIVFPEIRERFLGMLRRRFAPS